MAKSASPAATRQRPLVVLGLLGVTLDGTGTGRDRGRGPPGRWEKWRPTVDLCRHPDVVVDRLELLHQPEHEGLARVVAADIASVSPETTVVLHPLPLSNPWDFEEVYGRLHDFAAGYAFSDDVDYGVHITTGTHTAQICWFLLAESRRVPAKLLQTGPPRRSTPGEVLDRGAVGTLDVVDLDLKRYAQIVRRFDVEGEQGALSLAGGVQSDSPTMQLLLRELETVATRSTAPLLLQGETGVGKTQLARRVYELKKHKHLVRGPLVEVNCATLRGDAALSTLFGHKKGSYTGALSDRVGMLARAHGGVLFLDEVGELGLDEQAMLLKALEDKRFFPMGADREVESDFQLVCGTHRDLDARAATGLFREDLLRRIDVWRFALPPLRQRTEDLPRLLDVELSRCSLERGVRHHMTAPARRAYLDHAVQAPWPGNFRELAASVTRLCTLSDAGRIDEDLVHRELVRLRGAAPAVSTEQPANEGWRDDLDAFDAVQLAYVLDVCGRHTSLADAGRALFAVSRQSKRTQNDSDRLRKYLVSMGVDPSGVTRR